jgi:multiple sugar transport system permease protein
MLRTLQNSRNLLGLLFMLPAAVLLLLFLTYPLGLGVWLGFTDTKIGRGGDWIGLENYAFLWGDSVTRLALFNTIFYTVVASIIKFALGLWLAILLNERIPFKTFFRTVILLPYIVPTALSAIAFWWIYDSQFSIISWTLVKLGLIDRYIDFLGEPWNARLATIAANIWRGVPFVAITLLAGLQTISPSLYEAGAIDGATGWQRFRYITLPLLTPTTFFIIVTSIISSLQVFEPFYIMTKGGPSNTTRTIVYYIYDDAFRNARMGYATALAWVLVLITVSFTFLQFRLQKRWVHYG